MLGTCSGDVRGGLLNSSFSTVLGSENVLPVPVIRVAIKQTSKDVCPQVLRIEMLDFSCARKPLVS